jgi:hypothetical protein
MELGGQRGIFVAPPLVILGVHICNDYKTCISKGKHTSLHIFLMANTELLVQKVSIDVYIRRRIVLLHGIIELLVSFLWCALFKGIVHERTLFNPVHFTVHGDNHRSTRITDDSQSVHP